MVREEQPEYRKTQKSCFFLPVSAFHIDIEQARRRRVRLCIQGGVVRRAARGGEAAQRRGDAGREAIPSGSGDHQQGASQASGVSGGLLQLRT